MRLFLILILLSSFALYYWVIRLTPKEIASYETLIQESAQQRSRHALEETPAQQTRQGVQKDIWTQDETRHYQIQSEQSALSFTLKTVVEELKNIRCTLPDGFILTADEALYSYPPHQFSAEKNCLLTQNNNVITAEKIEFDFAKEKVTCENPKGRLDEGLNFTANTLLWDKKENKLYLRDQVQLISSRIQEKESFALADTLIYDLCDKTVLLTAKRKVLFWQSGLSLSAAEVLIRKDQTVEGKGDVHFSFDLDEQNTIDQFFKRYL